MKQNLLNVSPCATLATRRNPMKLNLSPYVVEGMIKRSPDEILTDLVPNVDERIIADIDV